MYNHSATIMLNTFLMCSVLIPLIQSIQSTVISHTRKDELKVHLLSTSVNMLSTNMSFTTLYGDICVEDTLEFVYLPDLLLV